MNYNQALRLFVSLKWNNASKVTIAIFSILSYIFSAWIYRRILSRIRRKRVQLVRRRKGKGSDTEKNWFTSTRLLRYFALDPAVCSSYDGVHFESLGEYMDSLESENPFSIEAVLISVMDRFGLAIALPLALFVPQTWKQAIHLKDVEQVLPYPEMLFGSLLSTKSLACVCEVVKQFGHGVFTKATSVERYSAMDLLVIGSNPKSDFGLSSMLKGTNVFHLSPRVLSRWTSALARDKYPVDAKDPKEIHSVFEGLYFGNQGLAPLFSPKEEMTSAIVSSLCNKLVANALVGTSMAPLESKQFRVRVGGKTVDSLEGFFAVLENMGHDVTCSMKTNVTSMGVGLSALCEDGVFSQIPLAYPLKTGLTIRKSTTRPVYDEAVTLMTHGAVFVRIQGPLIHNAEIEWCLNVTGLTGFQPVGGVHRPWQTDPRAFVIHTPEACRSADDRQKIFRRITCISAVSNCIADENHVVVGGYGFMGVCLDSIALLQHSLTGTCSMYPLFLDGAAKMYLVQGYKIFERENATYREDAVALRESLIQLPSDIIVPPDKISATATRALSSLPEKSVFQCLESCKAQLRDAIALTEE